ncbi:MAG TPA: lactonase family protein [Tepidisphaeraceae bacterium]|nr:lactonase family protein [Tepidisphaeraceae bacterium]
MTQFITRAAVAAFAALATLVPAAPATAADGSVTVYLGTYTRKDKSKGIYTAKLDLAKGTLGDLKVAAEIENPSYLALASSNKFLYAIGEVSSFQGKKGGVISAFSVEPDGTLKLLNQQSTVGPGPCYVSVDNAGKIAMIANYGGGSVAAYPIAPDGKLGEASAFIQHPKDEAAAAATKGKGLPRAHSINLDRANRFAFAADLGLNKIFVYKLNPETAGLTPHDPPAAKVADGAGPRHFAFTPDGRYAYVINELNMTMTAFTYNGEKGVLTEVQTISTLPAGESKAAGQSTAHVDVHPSGKFVYGSNRGHDTIVCYAIDPATGKLTLVGHTPTGGKTPRNFGIDPTGQYLLAANQGTDNVVVFKIDQATGKLTETGSKIEVGAPVCVKFVK